MSNKHFKQNKLSFKKQIFIAIMYKIFSHIKYDNIYFYLKEFVNKTTRTFYFNDKVLLSFISQIIQSHKNCAFLINVFS